MGGESAAGWIVRAIRGDDVPAEQRTKYNPETVFSRGSANICCLQATCAGWYWYHRDKAKARAVLRAWRGYLELRRWYTSEPWSSHRYGTWINMSYESVLWLAVLLGDEVVASGLRRYLRFEMLSTILTTGWISEPDRGFPYARGGSRSWCGWDGENGKGTGMPYAHLVEEAAIGRNVNNWIGRAGEANWELEPILKALARHGHSRWSYLDRDERTLCLILIGKSTPLSTTSLGDLGRLLRKIRDCDVQTHSTVHLVKTTQGTGWIAERTHGSGSTSFMVGKVWYRSGRNPSENRQVWAEEYNRHFAPLFEGNKARRSDPGGFGSVAWDGSRFVLKAWTGPGRCANGFEPGADRHNDGRHNPRDPDGWRPGPKTLTLGGERIWHVKMTGKTGVVQLLYPGGGDPTDPPTDPPPDDGPGWHSIGAAPGVELKFTTAAAQEALAVIDGGGNHIKTTAVAMDPERLALVASKLRLVV